MFSVQAILGVSIANEYWQINEIGLGGSHTATPVAVTR